MTIRFFTGNSRRSRGVGCLSLVLGISFSVSATATQSAAAEQSARDEGIAGGAAVKETTLVMEDAWVRAMPPGKPMTAAYVDLKNIGDSAVAVVSASADIAGSVELHISKEVDGYTKMQQIHGFAVAAGESVKLAPGGMHLMLFDLTYTPEPGDEVTVCIQLAGGGEVCGKAGVFKSVYDREK